MCPFAGNAAETVEQQNILTVFIHRDDFLEAIYHLRPQYAAFFEPEQVKGSLYVYLRDHGFEPVRALQHFRAVNAGAQRARLLSIREDAALVHVTRISYLADGRVVEVTQTLCRSDYYDFVVELRR